MPSLPGPAGQKGTPMKQLTFSIFVHSPGGNRRETDILYGSQDAMVPRATVDRFLRENPGRLTVMEGGEHWFHTPDQLAFLQSWEAQALRG